MVEYIGYDLFDYNNRIAKVDTVKLQLNLVFME